MKTCSRCRMLLDLTSFGKDGRQNYCKTCQRDYNRERDAALRAGEWIPGSRFRPRRSTADAATESPSVADIAWAAGFVEGEGTFAKRCCVTAAQVNEEPLLRLKKLFGGSIYTNRNNPCKTWCVCGSRARGFMYTIYTFLSARRRGQLRKAMGV